MSRSELAKTVVAECENMCEAGDVKGATLTVTFENGVTREVRIGEGAKDPSPAPSSEGGSGEDAPTDDATLRSQWDALDWKGTKGFQARASEHGITTAKGGREAMTDALVEMGVAPTDEGGDEGGDAGDDTPTPASDMSKQARGDLREAFEDDPENEHERVMSHLKSAEDYVAFAGACPFEDDAHGGRKMGRAVTPEGVCDHCQSHEDALEALTDDEREAFEAMRDSKGHAKALELAQA